MFRKLTLSFILTACALLVDKHSFANLITVNGGSTGYTLNSGDTLFIQSGTYTGAIGGFATGATIIISDLAIFQPTDMSFPNVRGTMYNYGTFIWNNSPQFRTNSDFTMHNYGMVQNNYETLMSGSNQTWTNYYGATMNFVGKVTMNGLAGDLNNVLNNYGTVNAGADFQMNSGSSFNNYKNFMVTGDFKANGGRLNNEGKLEVVGKIDLNSGVSTITNYCRMIASGGIYISNGNMTNYSYLWARNDLGLGDIRITSGNIFNVSAWSSTPIIHGRDLIHSGSGNITGRANLYFYGSTTKTGNGITGAAGVTTDTLKMNDVTRGSTTTFYDAQTPTVHPNAIYNVWGVPDSTRVYNIGCSVEIILEVPLAINWNSFDANLSNNIPVLNWSAEFVQGTVFEIQRSYDGRNFSSINALPYEVGQSAYEYKDRMVNTQAPIVYYRIKSIEISRVEKYTQTRIVKFSHKSGSIYTAPNPFTNNFIINYRAAERETITIRMFNVSGQQMLVKNVTVDNGNNNINITEAAHLAKGIYVIQVNKGYNMISSTRIVKQ